MFLLEEGNKQIPHPEEQIFFKWMQIHFIITISFSKIMFKNSLS